MSTRFAKRLLLPALLAGALLTVETVVADPPQGDFTVGSTPAGGCGTFSFTSNMTDADDDIVSLEWDLNMAGTFSAGNGSTITLNFPTPGERSVTLRATDGDVGDGEAGQQAFQTQQIQVTNTGTPSAVITPTPTSAEVGATVNFSSAGSGDSGGGSITAHQWDLDGDNVFNEGGTTGETNAASVSRAYDTVGAKTVRLRVVDNCGATSSTDSDTVHVNNAPPSASLVIDPNPAEPNENILFDARGSSAGGEVGDSITKYEWDLDGVAGFELDTAATGTVPRSFPSALNRNVRVRVTDENGGTATAVEQLRVNRAPIARFVFAPNPPLVGETVTFDAVSPTDPSFDPDGSAPLTKYEWDLDGDNAYAESGEPTGATATTATRAYSSAQTVMVGLRVTDEDGAVNEQRRAVNVQTTRPTAALTFTPEAPLPGQNVTLTSTSSPSTTPGAPALSATEWDFEYQPSSDFTVQGAGASITTSFPTAGPKTVAVKVKDASGGFAIASAVIVVNAPPVAAFTVAPARPLDGDDVTFASTSGDPDGPLGAQTWDLDADGQYDDAQGAVASRKLAKGTHVIRLRVTDSRGAATTTEQAITVVARPARTLTGVRRVLGYSPKARGIELKSLLVRVPGRSTVTVKCKGHGCPRGALRKRAKKTAQLRFKKLEGSLRAGTQITVIVTRPGYIGQYTTYKVRGKNRRPVRRELCIWPGAKKPRACPTS
ncbi:MAG: hypothetical protein QOH58_1514 [Thermoleophilaceae bacterium]|nr:hypothetical protein [Thermoleophilaceae bacterium]